MGVAKNYSTIDVSLLEACVREDLNKTSLRRMAVLKPIKVVIDNYPDDLVEEMEAVNNPEDLTTGTRKVPFSKVLYIEQDDFRETPPPRYFRLYPGNEVRLRYAYFIKCSHVVKDASGQVSEIHATYDPATHGGDAPDGRKVKSTIHWVSAPHAIPAEFRMYDRLFTKPDPEEGEDDFLDCLNPKSLELLTGYVEPGLGCHPGPRPLSIRTPGIFLHRPRLNRNKTGLQFNRFTQGFLGKDPKETSLEPICGWPLHN